MNPIHEGNDQIIGYNLERFIEHFIKICYEHLRERRAKAFAFIFFDTTDSAIIEVLRNRSTNTLLDRLSAKDLTVFYLNSHNDDLIASFNQFFFEQLGIDQAQPLPAIVFFQVVGDEAEDIQIHSLLNHRLTAYNQIERKITAYLKPNRPKSLRKALLIRPLLTWLAKEGIEIAADHGIKTFFGLQ